jgi:hypothetical protein
MDNSKVNWYSVNRDQKIEEHEPVDLKRAIEIADQYLARGGEKFKDGNEALAATMFGFCKSKTGFIEICVNGPKQISYKLESFKPNNSGLQKLRKGAFQSEEELQSREQLVQKITEFFSQSRKQIIQNHRGKLALLRRSPLGNRPNAPVGIRIFTIIFFTILAACLAYALAHDIRLGETSVPHRYSTYHRVIYRIQNPCLFWSVIAAYSAIFIWLIRGCWLEFKIVKKLRG